MSNDIVKNCAMSLSILIKCKSYQQAVTREWRGEPDAKTTTQQTQNKTQQNNKSSNDLLLNGEMKPDVSGTVNMSFPSSSPKVSKDSKLSEQIHCCTVETCLRSNKTRLF